MNEKQRPMLECPECGREAYPASARGLHDEDGNFIEHDEKCLCGSCDWLWFEDDSTVTCACGETLRVVIDGCIASLGVLEKI